jgi:DNA-directed RNA polymerase subunit F
MIGKGIVGERPLPLAEVLEILKQRKKEGELNYSQRTTYDYAQKVVELNLKKTQELLAELLKVEGLKESQAVALVDLMPKTVDDINLIFVKERTKLEETQAKQILEIIERYRK